MENYVELFISELDQYIKMLNNYVLTLERDRYNTESISEVFRIFHTIKGMAQTMGYDTLSLLSHRTEDLLGDAKKQGEVSEPVIDLLFIIADILVQSLQALHEKQPLPPVDEIIDVIERIKQGEDVHLRQDHVQTERLSEVRIKMHKLDTLFNLVNELTISRSRLAALSYEIKDERLTSLNESAARMITALQDEVMKLRMLPLITVFDFFPRWFRDETKRMQQDVELVIIGEQIEVDRSIIDGLKEPLMHLLRNALDHGVRGMNKKAGVKARVELRAERERDRILISVRDNGMGIDVSHVKNKAIEDGIIKREDAEHMQDYEVFYLLTLTSFSTRDEVTDISGRGVGLDIVRKAAERYGGRLQITSQKGKGTCFTLDLPLSMAIVRAMIVRIDGQRFALPLTYVRETSYIQETMLRRVYHHELLPLRDEILPLVRLGKKLEGGNTEGRKSMVVVEHEGKRRGFIVDSIIDEDEIVVKQLDRLLESSMFSGCSIYADGLPILILDPRGFV